MGQERLKSKTTQWFGWNRLPVRVGVYQREYTVVGIRFSYWDGHRWGQLALSPYIAEQNRHKISAFQNLRWRGLVEEEKPRA